jgi:hypothetical protein
LWEPAGRTPGIEKSGPSNRPAFGTPRRDLPWGTPLWDMTTELQTREPADRQQLWGPLHGASHVGTAENILGGRNWGKTLGDYESGIKRGETFWGNNLGKTPRRPPMGDIRSAPIWVNTIGGYNCGTFLGRTHFGDPNWGTTNSGSPLWEHPLRTTLGEIPSSLTLQHPPCRTPLLATKF